MVVAITQDKGGSATHFSACEVFDKTLSYSTHEDQRLLAAQVISCRGLAATYQLLLVARGPLQDEARAQLVAGQEKLHCSKHGRAFILGGSRQEAAGKFGPEA